MRAPYEGMWNVVRFNWPKYILGLGVIVAAFICARLFPLWGSAFHAMGLLAIIAVLFPLLVSHIIYDRSHLYHMPWMDHVVGAEPRHVLNLNAGFDESSVIIQERFPRSELTVVDLFDAARCTEPSIARARRSYPPYPGTLVIADGKLPSRNTSIDLVVAFLSLHEIRGHADRVALLKDVQRSLSPDGHLIVTEHLRDLSNALAFTIGVLHFHSRTTWQRAFKEAGLRITRTQRTAGFITTFILQPA